MPKLRLTLAALALSTSLAGCVNLLPNPEVPQALIALPADRAKAPPTPLLADVSVLPPDSSRAFSGVDMAVSNNQELVYLADVRWSDAAPRLLQNAVVNALSKAGGAGRVTTAQQGVRADYELRWRIIDLSVGKDVMPVSVIVSASVVDAESRRSIAQGEFKATGVPATRNPRDRAAALAMAAQDAADQVAAFAAKSVVPVAPFSPAPPPAQTPTPK
jgi:cholesterol transport system auxiliary component